VISDLVLLRLYGKYLILHGDFRSYDFGDNWYHNIIFEGIFPAEPGQDYPRCLEGERAEIPEDLGGIRQLHDLHKSLAKPEKTRSKDEREKLEWLYENKPNYDPAKFHLAEIKFRDSRLWLATRKTFKMSISTHTWNLPKQGSSDCYECEKEKKAKEKKAKARKTKNKK